MQRKHLVTGTALLLTAALAGAAIAQGQAPKPPSGGYLGAAAPDTYRILPQAPVEGTIRYDADRKAFANTRKLKDTPRWDLAITDVNQFAMPKHMACALGVELTAQNAPKTLAILSKMAPDVGYATNHPKDIYQRKRPYLIDEGPICVPKDPLLAASPDYPSGNATWGWTVALVLAELAPDRATEILIRGRAFGESRMVCGVHNMSAVEAARTNASALVAGLHGSAQFRADMEAAREEVAKARAAGPAPDAAACAKEADLTKSSPYY
jgi:acid phosphatase (class A)